MGRARALRSALLLLALVACAAADNCLEGGSACEGARASEAREESSVAPYRLLQPGNQGPPRGSGPDEGGQPSGPSEPGGGGGTPPPPCVDSDNGNTDSEGHNCSWYSAAPYACGVFDDSDFNATVLCCDCKPSLRPPPAVRQNCKDTNHHAGDLWGRQCDNYKYDHRMCSHFDTAFFQANTMCCTCGGGTSGEVCPHHAVAATPDADGLCLCGHYHDCEDSTQPGQGCPAQPGQRSTTHFHVNCKSCRCASEAELLRNPLKEESCEPRFLDSNLPDTSDSWMVHGVLSKVRDQIHKIMRAVSDVRGQWMGHDWRHSLLVWDYMKTEDMHRMWAEVFFRSIMNSNYFVRSCGVYLPGTGKGISLESGGCKDPEEQILLSSVNENGRVHSYRVRGVDMCEGKVQRTCVTSTVWVEGWSYNDTPVVHETADQSWRYGMAEPDIRHESWYPTLAGSKSQQMAWLDSWSSFLYRERMFGFGYKLLNPNVRQVQGLLRCSVSSRAMSNFFKTIVGAGARIFLMSVGGGLLGASHGEVEIPATRDDPFARTVNAYNSSDGVIRKVGEWLDVNKMKLLRQAQQGKIKNPHRVIVNVPELHLVLRTYIAFVGVTSTQANFFIVYVLAPMCIAGRENIVSSKSVSTSDLADCTECPRGKYADDGKQVGESCEPCTAGSYSSKDGSTRCFTCESGQYQNVDASTACKECPENTTSVQGSDSIEQCRCQQGFYSLLGTPGTSCRPCPAGATCDGEELPPLSQTKYFELTREVGSRRLSQGYVHREFIKCVSTLDSNPCKAGSLEVTQTGLRAANICEDGYEGIGCSHCSKGYFRFGRDCMECKSRPEDVLRIYWVALLVVFYVLRRIVNSKYKTLYIFLSFLQVFGLQASFSLAWPTNIKFTMRIIQVANLQVDLLMPSCEREALYVHKYLMYLAMPWFFLLVDLTVMFVNRAWKAITRRKHAKAVAKQEAPALEQGQAGKPRPPRQLSKPLPSAGGDRGVEDGEAESPSLRRKGSNGSTASDGVLELVRQVSDFSKAKQAAAVLAGIEKRSAKELVLDFLAQTLANMRLMYLSLCGRTLDMIQCTYMDGGLPPRLSKDMDIVCWEGVHMDYMPLTGLATVIYVIGTPLVYMTVLMKGYRSNELFHPAHLKRYGILYSRFEPTFFYWELVIMFRRVLAVIIKTVLNIRTANYQASGYIGNYQAALMASVQVIALAVHFYARPFCNPFLDFGDACYLGATFLSCVIGICFSTARSPEELEAMESLWFLNLISVCIITVYLVWRDIEAVHPKVYNARKHVTDRLGFVKFEESLKKRVRGALNSDRKRTEHNEVLTDINYEALARKPALGNVFKSVLVHAVHEKLEHLGLSPDHIDVFLSAGSSPNTVMVRTVIEPPSGTSPAVVEQAMSGHIQADSVQEVLQGIMEAVAPVSNRQQVPTLDQIIGCSVKI